MLEKFLGERSVPMTHGHGGLATYAHVGSRRGRLRIMEEVPKKRKLAEIGNRSLREKIEEISASIDVEIIQRHLPASKFELEFLGGRCDEFDEIQNLLKEVRPRFKYGEAFEGLF